MPTPVYFATNRVLTSAPEDWRSYGTSIVAPSDPTAITYATAFVDNTNLTADKTGAIQQIENVSKGRFSQAAIDDLSDPGRNLLVFVPGFANSFENAITRAAFNREWLAQSGVAAADTTVVAFTCPALGRLSALRHLAGRISIYFSAADAVLAFSAVINLGAKRLGQDGPHDRFDTGKFPPAQYRMVDCGGFRDYAFDFASSHQYYRRSP